MSDVSTVNQIGRMRVSHDLPTLQRQDPRVPRHEVRSEAEDGR
jgi:hypothetical protein